MGCQGSKVFVLTEKSGRTEEISESKKFSAKNSTNQTNSNETQKLKFENSSPLQKHVKRETSLPKLLPSMENSDFDVFAMKKETSDPCISSTSTEDKSLSNLRTPSVQSEFHNRKYWFMQNDSFRRRCSFDSLELGVAIGQFSLFFLFYLA